MEEQQGNIRIESNSASIGLDMDRSVSQIAKGKLSYALNASMENYDANGVSYQNEQGNELCLNFPEDFILIGKHFIPEQNKHIFFLVNPNTNDCQLGYMNNNDCQYLIYIDDTCLGWNINYPIQKVAHKITNCTTEIYWADNVARRYLDLNAIPRLLEPNSDLCTPVYSNNVDCNQLKLQPNFNIPSLSIKKVLAGGNITAGTVQFALQYSDAVGNPYTSYYSVTNPTPIFDEQLATVNFNYNVGKSVLVHIDNLDVTGQFQYFNLAVIKTVNAISSVELIGTYYIEQPSREIIYSGQIVDNIRLSISDIFEKFPYYELADDLTAVQDVLVWSGLTSIDRINYQSIASKIHLQWETYKLPSTEDYGDELNATNLRGYLRDEIYAFEIVFLLANGKQTDGFHIPGRVKNAMEKFQYEVDQTNDDFTGTPGETQPYWDVYNTALVLGDSDSPAIGNATAYKYGEMAYWESSEEYSCNSDIWGELAGQRIRHHKFPDILVSPIIESQIFTDVNSMVIQNDNVFPIGVKVDIENIKNLVANSTLSSSQKNDIVGFKIVRGDRSVNKSIVAKGILRNVGKYDKQGQTYYYPNYPYNDLQEDPFLTDLNNAKALDSRAWFIECREEGTYSYTDIDSGKIVEKVPMIKGTNYEFCSLTKPEFQLGKANIGPANYDVAYIDPCGQYYNSFYAVATSEWTVDSALSKETDYYIGTGQAGSTTCFQGVLYARLTPGDKIKIKNPGDCNTSNCDGNPYLKYQAISLGKNPDGSYNYTEDPTKVLVAEITVLPDKYTSRRSPLNCGKPKALNPFIDTSLANRQIFNSPETSFGQPFLGNILKLESIIYGKGKAHFIEVKKNAKYKLLTDVAQQDALDSSAEIGAITTDMFNATAMFTAYQAYLAIYLNGITRKNYAVSFNSRANYDYTTSVLNNKGIKQRKIKTSRYLIPSVQAIGEDSGILINNYQRETSVYIKTEKEFLYPSDNLKISSNNIIDVKEKSRFTIGETEVCSTPEKEQDINVVSYYASMKNSFVNQWGQIYSYNTIDTGFQHIFNSPNTQSTVFGGDTFISRFSFKTKLPFFFDNRVGAPDDSDIFYDEIGNIAYPKYWHSSRSILSNYNPPHSTLLTNVISHKANNFDCPNEPKKGGGTYSSYYDGYFYLFAYGIPNFYCESSYNTDLRQAINNREGDFWPHVSTGIPDEWLQESFVSISFDNTYNYNTTYSKQNKENFFSHLPADYNGKACYTNYPFRAIYSDSQNIDSDNRVNSWLTYRSVSYFDFPQNYGALISLDGIQNRAILARFENKSLLYNNLLTVNTSNPQAAYMGNPSLFKGAPPIDFAETDLGYVGSQNKFLLKIPQGQITIDAKRGQIFLISGTQIEDLSGFGSGLNRFFTDHLAFEILRYFPDYEELINSERILIKGVDTDNNFKGIGLHGVYDSKFDRVIISKLDYIPIDINVKYDYSSKEFYIEETISGIINKIIVDVTDTDYFCNKSWTVSFNMNTKSWISFHSYIPNYYIAENNFFYSGIQDCCTNFDFVAGELLASPTTTSTTTTSTTSTSTTSTTTTTMPLYCNIQGNVIITNCVLGGTGTIIVPSPPPPCLRPDDLQIIPLIYGYDILSPFTTVDSTLSSVDACNALNYIKALSYDYSTIYIHSINGELTNLSLGGQVYAENNSTDCSTIPNGWYFNDISLRDGLIYNIVSGVIIEVQDCFIPTTTTTSTTTIYISCLEYKVTSFYGSETITYIDCNNISQTLVFGNNIDVTINYFCARTIVSNTGALIEIFGGC